MIDHKLTYGQACCLTLGLPPTDENRKKAKDYFEASLLVVCYLDSLGPRRPISIGKDVMARDPFTFQSYSTTRPSSPIQTAECSTESSPAVEHTVAKQNERETCLGVKLLHKVDVSLHKVRVSLHKVDVSLHKVHVSLHKVDVE
ncbi:hypothetical protein DM01DRAFT_1399584 [Hesseltinella vesiculosa]|uniref:Uncharacterized protein n=1 Tax=Hesseltinella vesiculosa TaxID=101127 RepID=A0A1X2G387_9FUNG|nr:hypothetical protein DM01DRAFT_1399584 [Hesseltinella vesiculosa]